MRYHTSDNVSLKFGAGGFEAEKNTNISSDIKKNHSFARGNMEEKDECEVQDFDNEMKRNQRKNEIHSCTRHTVATLLLYISRLDLFTPSTIT